jgi:hypothetical protein
MLKNRFLDIFSRMMFSPALTFYPLPRERKWLSLVSGYADERPANPVV